MLVPIIEINVIIVFSSPWSSLTTERLTVLLIDLRTYEGRDWLECVEVRHSRGDTLRLRLSTIDFVAVS